jgi:hypothetical protein
MELTWSARCLESIKKEKAEAEKRYGIRISQTEVYCVWCGKPANFFHTCQDMSPERREEIEGIRADYDKPWVPWKTDWQSVFGIEFGMSKEEAFEKFIDWQQDKKTCQRCEGDKYWAYCPIRLVCKEANNVRDNAQRDDNGSRINEINGIETLRIISSETRKRASLR